MDARAVSTPELLGAHRKELDTFVKALLAYETLDEHQITAGQWVPPAPALETGHLAVAGVDRRNAVIH
jgi:hypothetical protein